MEAKIVQLEKELKAIQPDDENAIGRLSELEQQNEQQAIALRQFASMADELRPMTRPTKQIDGLGQLSAKVGEQLKAKKTKAEELAAQKAAEETFTTELTSLQAQTSGLEQLVSGLAEPSSAQLLAIMQEQAEPLAQALKDFEQRVPIAPNEELKQQRAKLKTELAAEIQQKLATKMAEAKREEELADHISQNIQKAQQMLAQLRDRYAQPQHIDLAKADAERLAELGSELAKLPLEQLRRKPLRDQKADQLAPIRTEMNVSERNQLFSYSMIHFQTLLSTLKGEIGDEEKLTRDYAALREEILQKTSELPTDIEVSKNLEMELARTGELKQSVPLLRQRLETFMQTSEQAKPKRLMVSRDVRAVQEDQLDRQLAELESSVDKMVETLVIRIKVTTMTPQLETLMLSTQRAVDEANAPEVDSLERQEASLRELEEQKQKLANLLEQLPAKETEALRAKGSGQLGQLEQHIQRLGQKVGQRMATLAQFLAARTEVLEQLEGLNRKLEQQRGGVEQSGATKAEEDPMAAQLSGQQNRLGQLHAKFDQLDTEQLDGENRAELDKLNKYIQLKMADVEDLRRKLQVRFIEIMIFM